MKRLTLSAAILSLLLFGQCKRECVGLTDSSVMLKSNEVNSLAYKGQDSLVFLEDGVLKTFVSGIPKQYYNTYTPNTNCSSTLKLEGNQILFKDSTALLDIYHNQSVNSSDTTTSFITITYRGRNFGFPYIYLNSPYPISQITINGKVYLNVYRAQIANDSIYYNKEDGIIRIKLESGHLLQLP